MKCLARLTVANIQSHATSKYAKTYKNIWGNAVWVSNA